MFSVFSKVKEQTRYNARSGHVTQFADWSLYVEKSTEAEQVAAAAAAAGCMNYSDHRLSMMA